MAECIIPNRWLTISSGAGPFGKVTAVALLQEIAHPRLRASVIDKRLTFPCREILIPLQDLGDMLL
jgi:hypothetical protein